MTVWDTTYYGNTVRAWLFALLLMAVVMVVLKLLTGVILRRLSAFAKKTKTELDDLVADLIARTKLFFLLIVSIYFATFALSLPQTATRVITTVAMLALLIQAAIWASGFISFWLTRQMKRKLEEDAATATTYSALRFLSKLIVWSAVLLLVLDNLGVDITTLVAGLGVGGIAVALAVQNILGDLFASLSIVLDKPFVIGDFIIVGDLLGTVEKIGLKTTRVRSLYGEQLVFSNNDLLQSRIRNYKRMFERRIVFHFGVTYQTPYEKLAAIPDLVREIVEAQEKARFDRAHFKEYGDFSLNFEVVYYVQVPDYNVYMDIQQAINLAIYKRFEDEEIGFAYPTQTIYMKEEEASIPALERKEPPK
ncbi:MAG: mechanosensitive ion channel protein MscS [candidate division Zixibacteria bacterium SM23_81]|nr:MAG: mechanosensitive ion channel protein MscS [candidate division Zixibacteria bacterium SM23_81]